MTQEALKLALEALENNKLNHLYCEDTWYSCPKHEDGCANEAEGDECNCGADEVNAQFDNAITAIKEALAQPEQIQPSAYSNTHQPEQEPVAIMREMLEVQGQHGNWNYDSYMHGLYNGMEYMVALAEKREPKFRDAPETWLAKYEVKRGNFNSTEPLTEATPPQRTWVGLTDEERDHLEGLHLYAVRGQVEAWIEGVDDFAQAIEAKLKEKNT